METLYVQIMPELDAEKVPYHPFDLTKVWPKGDYPLIEVGEFELNRNPENYFQDVEQAAFAPSNLVPGISYSPVSYVTSAFGQLCRCCTLPCGCKPFTNSSECCTLPCALKPP